MLRKRAWIVASGVVFCLVLYLWYATRVDPERLRPGQCTVFLDRKGRVLRFVPDSQGLRHRWVSLKEMPGFVPEAFIAAEDERFYSHYGVDIVAVLRALRDNILKGRIVSGASTITQQLCRLAYPRGRTYREKFIEMLRSIRVEMALDKARILELYLNRVPMGGNITGVDLAAKVYFGKPLSDITLAEAATLASLPKAPAKYNPLGPHRNLLIKRRNWVLGRMKRLGFISEREYKEAVSEALHIERHTFPFNAPHLVDLLLNRLPAEVLKGQVYTTVDLAVQEELEKVLISHKDRLRYRGARQAAAIVVHNPTMEVLAMAGSMKYGPEDRGFVNGAVAPRSAGSTLKPFLYALAIESGFLPTHILSDTTVVFPSPSGDYIPVNYDRRQYGPVMMRTALGSSLNLSAVKMLNSLGLERFYEFLRQLHLINHPEYGPRYYGLGLAIGNPEVSLEQLVTAYAMLANGGIYRPLRYLRAQGTSEGSSLLSPATAYIITDMLSDPAARALTFGNTNSMNFPFKIALKTGTSTKYRDCWIVGYTPEYTVGVWVGNFEGTPTWGLSGASAAAPILKDIMDILYRRGSPSWFSPPRDVSQRQVCAISGMKPGPYCRYKKKELFIKGTEPEKECTFHTSDVAYHMLPAQYARWLYEKTSAGTEGGYRLKGLPTDLKDLFRASLPEAIDIEGHSINIRGAVQETKSENRPGTPYRGHLSIGHSMEEPPEASTGEIYYVKIIYPLDGDHFVSDADPHEIIRLQALTTGPLPYVIWFVDGEELTRAGPPYDAYWKPAPGVHTITASSPQNTGDSIEVVVE